jgi:hypothetical protein
MASSLDNDSHDEVAAAVSSPARRRSTPREESDSYMLRFTPSPRTNAHELSMFLANSPRWDVRYTHTHIHTHSVTHRELLQLVGVGVGVGTERTTAVPVRSVDHLLSVCLSPSPLL